jgi:peptide/nickel transport system substrate-binding protein
MKRELVAACLCAILATPAVAEQQPKQGGTLAIRLNSDIRSLEPGVNRDTNTDNVLNQMFEGLVAYRADMSVGPALAESWTVSDDGKTYRFVLRDGITFHNGAPLTSAEVKWSWSRLQATPAWQCRNVFDGSQGVKVTEVEASEPRVIIYRLEKPSGLFLKQLANVQCGVLVSHPDSVDAQGQWRSPIGTGPFKLAEWKHDQYVDLDRFADYRPSTAPASGYAGARIAYVDHVRFSIIPDDSAARAALQTNAVDLITEVQPEHIAELQAAGLDVQTAPGLARNVLLINDKDPLLANPKVREAIAEAIDRDQIAEARTLGLAKANSSAVSASMAYFDPAFLAWPTYDPSHAAALLKAAGYRGEPIKLQTNKRYPGMDTNSILLQAMLSAVGLNVQIETLDWATQLDHYMKGDFQMQSFAYSGRFDPTLTYATFLADRAKFKWAQWDDPKALDMLREAMETSDEARRKQLFLDLHDLLKAQIPTIGLFYEPAVDAVTKHTHGYHVWAPDRPIAWGVWKD